MPTIAVENPRAMRFLIQWVAQVDDHLHRALGEAMVQATEIAYSDAVKRARDQFNNTPGYPRTGGLMNAIYRGFDKKTGKGFLGVDSPYGALQEFGSAGLPGGVVKPVKAKHLWIKQWLEVPGALRRMVPKEWMDAHKADPEHFPFIGRIAAYRSGKDRAVAMFILADEAKIPARPYIRPAVDAAFAQLPALLQSRLRAAEGTT